MVGVYQATNGNMGAQQEALAERVMDMGTRIQDNWVPQKMLWQGFKTMIWPSIWYPLPVCSLTTTEAGDLTTGLYKMLLPKLGVTQSFPKVY